MNSSTKIEIFHPDGSLKDPALILLTGLALGLTLEQIAVDRHWSPSKTGRWKGALQEHFGKHILTVVVMLINQNKLRPSRLSGWFDDRLGNRYEETKAHFSSHRLDSRRLQDISEALAQLPAAGGWTRGSCPKGLLRIFDELHLADDGSSLIGLYGLILAVAAENKQLHFTALPAVITVRMVVKFPGDITVTVEGPPGAQVDEHLQLTLPGQPNADAGPAD